MYRNNISDLSDEQKEQFRQLHFECHITIKSHLRLQWSKIWSGSYQQHVTTGAGSNIKGQSIGSSREAFIYPTVCGGITIRFETFTRDICSTGDFSNFTGTLSPDTFKQFLTKSNLQPVAVKKSRPRRHLSLMGATQTVCRNV